MGACNGHPLELPADGATACSSAVREAAKPCASPSIPPADPSIARPVAPLLVIGWGNRSRADDALGPMAVDALRLRWAARADQARRAGRPPLAEVDFLEEHQLQVEHALDLIGRRAVLWIDASRCAATPFEPQAIEPRHDASLFSHALSPQAVMQVFIDLQHEAPPRACLLGIAARRFAMGEAPNAEALGHLAQAVDWAEAWLLREALP